MTSEQKANLISDRIWTLNESEKKVIIDILDFHECEPKAAAERISEYIKCDYYAIFDLL